MSEATLELHVDVDGETLVSEIFTVRNSDRSQVTALIEDTLRSAAKLLERLADKEADDD